METNKNKPDNDQKPKRIVSESIDQNAVTNSEFTEISGDDAPTEAPKRAKIKETGKTIVDFMDDTNLKDHDVSTDRGPQSPMNPGFNDNGVKDDYL